MPRRHGLSAAQAHQREKQADATRASLDVERFKGLVAKDEISRQQFDNATGARDAATAAAEAGIRRRRRCAAHRGDGGRTHQTSGARCVAGAGCAGSGRTGPQQVTATRARAAAAAARVRQAQAALAQAKLNSTTPR